MGTFKRTPFEIDTTIKNGSRFLNQTQFSGIVQNNNSFEVDQNAFTDALNVYVNDQNTLVSREPLIVDTDLPIQLETNEELINIKEINGVKVYVIKNESTYTIKAIKNNTTVDVTSSNYHLTTFNQYVICFREEGAMLLNTNETDISWKSMDNFAEIPITKIVTGNDIETRDHNRFTNTVKEQYIITEEINTVLPDDNPTSVEILKDNTSININNFKSPKELIDFRLYTTCNYSVNAPQALNDSQITVYNNIVCIKHVDGFLLSRDYGQTFVLVVGPYTTCLLGPILSDDGSAVFAVTEQCVYRCLLSDYSWKTYYVRNDNTKYIKPDTYVPTISNYKFVNSETFMFMYVSYTNRLFYFKANNLYTDTKYNNVLDYISLNDYIKYPVRSITRDTLYKRQNFAVAFDDLGNIAGCFTTNCNTSANTAGVCLTFFTASDSGIKYNSSTPKEVMSGGYGDNSKYLTITEASVSRSSNNERTIRISGIDSYAKKADVSLYSASIKAPNEGNDWSGYNFTNNTSISKYVSSTTMIIKLADGIYVNSGWGSQTDKYLIDIYNDKTYNVPAYTDKNGLEFNLFDIVIGTNSDTIYYIAHYAPPKQNTQSYCLLSTNLGTSTAVFEYTKTDNTLETILNKVPTFSYSGSELFLVFDNEIKITKNIKDGSDTLFNLPKLNNQSFANTIKAVINISTAELAIFFENGITICSKVSDEVHGYRYDYSKTRLTLGTKFGDSVINTADGASTLYATPRGLAIMNYQAYMATTDQTLQFISDKIYDIWNKFYLSSENITLLQHGDYIFVYNTTNKYLMLDMRNTSWWKFEIPYNIKKLLTDQIDLRVIADKLYKFKKIDNNTDKIEDDYIDNRYRDPEDETINWRFMSQRLHFGLPNHYKNMKQIVFHMVQSTGHLSTFATQIKLYRNSVNYKDMEVIPFDFNFYVDEFRTFVKRFNYWKINMLQYGIANDSKTAIPARLVLNGIGVKYEIGDEVR